MKYLQVIVLFVQLFICTISRSQSKTDITADSVAASAKDLISSQGPNHITRSLQEDKKGNIWMASFGGVFRYDGNFFTNITKGVSSARFFSILADRKGNFWFGSLGSGAYYYDGKTFQQFTTKEGLPNNEIVCIYEDRSGNIWFGANGGASRYDGNSFRNFMIEGDSILEDNTGKTFPDLTRPPKEVNAIVEDNTGKFWFGTRGNAFIYDGKAFSVLTYKDKPFQNVRTIIKDSNGNIWLGGKDGLWRYDGKTFTNFTGNFVGCVYEDKKGNIWTSSETVRGWALSRYDVKTLSHEKPRVIEIPSNYQEHKGMLFGILEATNGNIWFGSFGVYRYNGTTITDFKN